MHRQKCHSNLVSLKFCPCHSYDQEECHFNRLSLSPRLNVHQDEARLFFDRHHLEVPRVAFNLAMEGMAVKRTTFWLLFDTKEISLLARFQLVKIEEMSEQPAVVSIKCDLYVRGARKMPALRRMWQR